MWVKPVLKDDWGYKTVHLGEPNKTLAGTWDNDPGVPEVKVGVYKVRWPDGGEDFLSVIMVPYAEQVFDHGHQHTVRSLLPHVVFIYHGAEIKIPLHEASVEVWRE